ncbi:family 43 glycosylhydrolase [Enterococcus timonensis]|uniref:family 43 glycosylhydrolase n=1 Tax=Enterococcus timonensis TaxID=1852364 RepID=UPI0008DB0FB0|nr:family 43 glycosylhydrolase [Enterococcus timonensis]
MTAIIANGIPWFDQTGNTVNAHGGSLLKQGDHYYFFGEYKTNQKNHFTGFSCYSSVDLVNWNFEEMSLVPQSSGYLGPNRIGERVKVIQCPETNQFIMLMHTDSLLYDDPVIGLAISDEISGPYNFLGALKFQNQEVRAWDMGVFVDDDGVGYLVLHEGTIYQLSKDFKSGEKKVLENLAPGGESPVLFKQNEEYFFIFSHKTSWERNDNYYFYADKLSGPWHEGGLFCPPNTLTHNSQSTFVFKEKRNGQDCLMFMGDRWSFPKQKDGATYVWLPLICEKHFLSIPQFFSAWDYQTGKEVSIVPQEKIIFRESQKGKQFQFHFTGKSVALFGETNQHSGYAEVLIFNDEEKVVHQQIIDFYSYYLQDGLRYISPTLSEGTYQVKIMVTGEFGQWTNKAKKIFGSSNSEICLNGYTVYN